MTACRPVLLVDIDGVLSPVGIEGCPEGFCEYELFPDDDAPVLLAAIHGEWLRERSAVFDLAWASAWGFEADRLIGPILGLPHLPFVPMPPIPFPPDDKVPAIAKFVGERPAAWIDDNLGQRARRWAEGRRAPTLLVEIDHRAGLTRSMVDQLLSWVQRLS